MEKVNLYKQLLSERNSSIESKNIDNFLKSIFERKDIKQTLNKKNTDSFNQLDFDKMETKNIFHLKNIEKICIKYRSRFLDSNLFKGDYPKNISNIISDIENLHKTKLKNFPGVWIWGWSWCVPDGPGHSSKVREGPVQKLKKSTKILNFRSVNDSLQISEV